MTHTQDSTSEEQLRALITERIAALAAKDGAALDARLAPDVVLFDALPPLRRSGRADVQAKTTDWLAGYAGPIGYEVREVTIVAGSDVAFCHYLSRVTGTLRDGQAVDMWVRTTLGCQKGAGGWTISHEHTSVPFDAATGQAAVALHP